LISFNSLSQVEITIQQLRIFASHNVDRLELKQTTLAQSKLIDSLKLKCSYQEELISLLKLTEIDLKQKNNFETALFQDSLQFERAQVDFYRKEIKRHKFRSILYTATGAITGVGAGIIYAIVAIKD